MQQPYYNHNNVTIYCGDNTEILQNIKPQIDVVITDPPFGIDYQNHYTHNRHDKLKGDSSNFSYTNWATAAFSFMKENAALFAYTGWSEYPNHYNEIKQCGFKMKEPLIVQKRPSGTNDLFGSFQSNADWIIFAHKGKFKFRPTQLIKNKKAGTIPNKGRKPVPEFKTRFPSCWFGKEFPWSTENPSSVNKWRHPTIKSVELMKWLILLSTDENDTVVDPFMGTGSTLIAAKLLNRKAIGIEIKESYCNMSKERLEAII